MSTTIAISLPDEQVALLRLRAAQEDRPLSRVVGHLIAAGMAAMDARACSTPRPSAPKRTRRGKG